MKIISVLGHAKASIGPNEAGYIEGEGGIAGEGFANKGKVCMLSAFHETTGPNEPIEAIPLHSFYLSLQMRTGRLLMRNTPSKFGDLVLQARVLVPLLLDQHDHPLEGRRWVLLVDRMLVYSAQLGRALGRLVVFLFAHGQEIVL